MSITTVFRDLPCCIDCRHARIHRGSLLVGTSRWLGIPQYKPGAGVIEDVDCTRFAIAGRDPVNGIPRLDETAIGAVECRSFAELCGLHAKFFEAREP